MQAKSFLTQEDFRQWLEEKYVIESELLVGYYKPKNQSSYGRNRLTKHCVLVG